MLETYLFYKINTFVQFCNLGRYFNYSAWCLNVALDVKKS